MNSDYLWKDLHDSSDGLTGHREQPSGRGKFQTSLKPPGRHTCLNSFATNPTISDPIVMPSKSSLEGRGTSIPRMTSSLTPIIEGGEDDIPVSIRKSFKELRSVKDELERQVRALLLFLLYSPEPSRQRCENDRLRAELAISQKEAADTLARFENMKQLTKRSTESISNRYVKPSACRSTNTPRTDLRIFARSSPHSRHNPTTLSLSLRRLDRPFQISVTCESQSRIVYRVRSISSHP